MGKIRVAALGDESSEEEQKRRAEARRQTKKSKKDKVEGVGLKGGERTVVVEGSDLKPEFKKLIEEVESGAPIEVGKKKARAAKQHVYSPRYKRAAGLVDRTKTYAVPEAVTLVKRTSFSRFDGTVELHMNLNPLSLGEKKEFRTSVSLPHGTGKQIRIAIADDAVLTEIEAGKINFDILVAHPSMMPKLAKVARVLGPKGLMPNPKNGTVSPDPEKRAKELSAGQMQLKSEPSNPIVHLGIGKVSFDDKKLSENINAVLDAVGRSKILRATLSASMGPGIKLTVS